MNLILSCKSYMTTFHLPIRALYDIRAFSRPLTRTDWRTCKQNEADILSDFASCIDDQDDLQPLDEDWTLFGKLWYLKTDANLVANRPPRCPPPPFEVYDREYQRMEFPCQLHKYQTDFSRIRRWYQKQAQWIHY